MNEIGVMSGVLLASKRVQPHVINGSFSEEEAPESCSTGYIGCLKVNTGEDKGFQLGGTAEAERRRNECDLKEQQVTQSG